MHKRRYRSSLEGGCNLHYDISRTGYHDTLDNMANIDLDYCAAVTAIAIEAVADTACAPP